MGEGEGYGIEKPEDGGRDVTVSTSSQGNYGDLFEEVYQAIANNKPYVIKEEDVIAQLEILEAE